MEGRTMPRIVILAALLVASAIRPASAQSPTPAYVVLGDSIEFGLDDGIPADGLGYVPLVAAFLTTFFGASVELHNFGEPFAQTRDIWREQLPDALAGADGNAPIVVSWGGGGNDLADVATGPQAAACRQSQSCLGRFNGLLNEIEQTIDRTIRGLREGLGPDAVILMRTQYNALLRTGCATPADAALATITLEGLDGTVLDRGLNDRIRSVAEKYDAQVVDLFLPFAVSANTLVAADCIHPSGVGYQAIAMLSGSAFLAAQ
jgi:lysophospholipase L1-like esterase